MSSALPSLSVGGLITDPRLIVKRAIEYYDGSVVTQSNLFFDQVRSLTQRIVQYSTSPSKLASAVQEDLLALLSPYLDNLEVNAKVSDAPEGRFNIDVSGSYQYLRRKYDLAEQMIAGVQ